MFLEHFHNKISARAIGWIVEFPAAPIRPEMCFVLPAEKRALMMVKPPGQPWVARILEIDDGIFVPIKPHIQEQLARAMGKTLVLKFTILMDCIQIEIAENSCGSEAIEAIIVKIYLHHPHRFQDTVSFRQMVFMHRGAKE
jgi:hypothetical protein